MNRKLVKRSLVLIVILVLLPVVVVTVAGLFLPKDALRSSLAEGLAESTGADVALGDVSVRLWPSLGVKLDGGTLTGTGTALAAATGSPNKLGTYRLDIATFEVGVALGPLFRKQISVEEIRLSGPRLEVTWDQGAATATDYDLVLSQVTLPVDAARAAGSAPPAAGRPVGELIPEDLSFLLRGDVAGLTVQGLPLEKVNLSGEFADRVLTLESLTADLGSGRLEGTAEIDYQRDPEGTLDFEAETRDVPAGVLLTPWAPAVGERLSCALNVVTSGTCRLKDGDTAKMTLSLTGEAHSGEGVLEAGDWLKEVAPYLGDRQDLKTVRFRQLDHEFRVDRGRYIVEEILIDGHDTHWLGSGSVGFDDTMDLGLTVKLPADFTPDLGGLSFLADTLRDPQGRVNLSLTFTGQASRPTVGVDLSGLQTGGADQGADAVKKGLGGLLDKWKTR